VAFFLADVVVFDDFLARGFFATAAFAVDLLDVVTGAAEARRFTGVGIVFALGVARTCLTALVCSCRVVRNS
jgi:hypothetical protein